MIYTAPKKFFLVSGIGIGSTNLNSFDDALQNSGIGDTNLIRLSSILPPKCQRISFISIPKGSLLPVAYSTISSSEQNCIISSAVSIAVPENENEAGLIMEYSAIDSEEKVIEEVISRVEEGMESRNRKIKEILTKSISVEISSDMYYSTFSAVVLWN